MTDLSRYKGIAQFGTAYQVMLERDSHAPGSVDRVLLEQMVRLCAHTAPALYGASTPTDVLYRQRSRPELEHCVVEATADRGPDEERIEGIARFCAGLAASVDGQALSAMRLGGTEEQIVRRGSDWCTDVARVACALCQVAGFPARLVHLFDMTKAYSGHAITEVYRACAWGAVDAITAVVYRRADGRPATTWELMNDPTLAEAHQRKRTTAYTTVSQFTGAAISNYSIRESSGYDYTISTVNEYCRSILRESERGWPGGLRWLHGEDEGGG